MRKAREDPKLAEVKAVLKKLQRLDVSTEAQPSPDPIVSIPSRNVPPDGSANQLLSIFERKQAAFSIRSAGPSSIRSAGPRLSQRRVVYAAAAVALIAGASVIVAVHKALNSPTDIGRSEERSPMRDQKNEGILLTEARRLLGEGDVAAARQRLMQGGPEVRAELAFLLAQSFDPNYLRLLPASNGLPDRVEAERWYKKWYELAVNSGLEMDSGRLQRIIKAMR